MKLPPPLPPADSALRAFLDEVVVPILIERFLREHRAMHERDEDDRDGREGGVSESLPLRDDDRDVGFDGNVSR